MAFTYDDVCTALADFVAAPEDAVDYRVDNKEFKNSQQAELLLKQAEFLAKYPVGDFETVAIDLGDIDGFGIDHTQRSVPQ
jgi:hypothetical protein